MIKFIVQSASASMPSSVKSPYRRVAVLEVNDDLEGPASMISTHSRDVIKVVETWERCHACFNWLVNSRSGLQLFSQRGLTVSA